MTTTRGKRFAERAERSQSVADAYVALRALVMSDERFAVLREQEGERLQQLSGEYDNDADDLRMQALLAGYDPESDQ